MLMSMVQRTSITHIYICYIYVCVCFSFFFSWNNIIEFYMQMNMMIVCSSAHFAHVKNVLYYVNQQMCSFVHPIGNAVLLQACLMIDRKNWGRNLCNSVSARIPKNWLMMFFGNVERCAARNAQITFRCHCTSLKRSTNEDNQCRIVKIQYSCANHSDIAIILLWK